MMHARTPSIWVLILVAAGALLLVLGTLGGGCERRSWELPSSQGPQSREPAGAAIHGLNSPPAEQADRSRIPDGSRSEDAPRIAEIASEVREVRVQVVGPQGEGVTARIECKEVGNFQTVIPTRTDGSGVARIVLPKVGDHLLVVSEFPSQYLTPAKFMTRRLPDPISEFDVLVAEESEDALVITMRMSATIEGYVRDERNRGIGGVYVVATPFESARTTTTITGTDGYYILVCPAEMLRLRLTCEPKHPQADRVLPPARVLDLAPGVNLREDFALVEDQGSVSGEIIDQDGSPFSGLEVLCYYYPGTFLDRAKSATTGPDGRFYITGLPPLRIAIQVEPYGFNPVGRGAIGMIVPPTYLDLTAKPAVDLGKIVAYRSRPYLLNGEVRFTPEWARLHASTDASLTLSILLSRGVRRSEPEEVQVQLTRASPAHFSFTWTCETPEDEVWLTLHGPGGIVVQRDLQPVEHGQERLILTVP